MIGMSGSLTVETVVRVAEAVVRHDAPGYEIVGVKLNDRDADYTEVIVRVIDCDREPCVVTVGVFRGAAEAALRKELGDSLRRRDAHRRGTHP
jgi:hypothetical protein